MPAGDSPASRTHAPESAEHPRMLRELRPGIALFENVPGLLVSEHGRFFERVLKEGKTGRLTEDAEFRAESSGFPAENDGFREEPPRKDQENREK